MARVDALLEHLGVLSDVVGDGDAWSTSGPSAVEALRALGVARRRLDALGSELAAVVERESQGENSLAVRFGEKSAAALVAHLVGIEVDEAWDWCAAGGITTAQTTLLGETLPLRHPETANAVTEGLLGVRAARILVETLDAVAEHTVAQNTVAQNTAAGGGTDLADIERVLVEVAPRVSLRELRRLCAQVIDRANPDGVQPREDELRAKSGLQIINRRDGLVQWIITMHPEAAGFATTALDARTAPRRTPTFRDAHDPAALVDDAFEVDDRTMKHRRLDAFTGIMRDSLTHDSGEVAGTSVTMVVTVAYGALVSGIGAATIEGIDTPISIATARRLACDANILPAVLGSPTEPLDLGRTQRLFNHTQRRAIALRDRGCTWPGCTAPPGWCEIAHIIAWYLGGPTDLNNGLMLCPFHHRRFDTDGWNFHWQNGAPYFIPPPHLDASRTPRRGGRPRAELLFAG